MGLPTKPESHKITKLLGELTPVIDDLLLSGLAAASDSTRNVLVHSFQSASQMRLLRLGSTIRVAAEEVARYASNDPRFSRRRYSFFINRAWMLIQGMRQALENEDADHWRRLTWQPGGEPVSAMQVVTLGVSKRVVPGAFCGFEFRLRRVDDQPLSSASDAGQPLIWSTVFPLKKSAEVPAEAYLRLAQKQKFKASEFLEGCVMRIENFQLGADGRIQLTDKSTVQQLEKFDDWDRFLTWSPAEAASRAAAHEINPFELDIEMQEEIVLQHWKLGQMTDDDRERRVVIEVISGPISFTTFASDDAEGKSFVKRLEQWAKKASPLFGILHYEHGAMVLQPLSVFDHDGLKSLSLDDKEIDYRSLLKALDF